MLQFRAKMDLGAMAVKGYSAFPKALALLEPFILDNRGIFSLLSKLQRRSHGSRCYIYNIYSFNHCLLKKLLISNQFKDP